MAYVRVYYMLCMCVCVSCVVCRVSNAICHRLLDDDNDDYKKIKNKNVRNESNHAKKHVSRIDRERERKNKYEKNPTSSTFAHSKQYFRCSNTITPFHANQYINKSIRACIKTIGNGENRKKLNLSMTNHMSRRRWLQMHIHIESGVRVWCESVVWITSATRMCVRVRYCIVLFLFLSRCSPCDIYSMCWYIQVLLLISDQISKQIHFNLFGFL